MHWSYSMITYIYHLVSWLHIHDTGGAKIFASKSQECRSAGLVYFTLKSEQNIIIIYLLIYCGMQVLVLLVKLSGSKYVGGSHVSKE